jgi:DNA mismatch repair protein MutS2
MGLSPRIIERARSLVESSQGPVGQALALAEKDRQSAADELDKASAAKEEASRQRDALMEERRRFQEEKDQAQADHARALVERLRAAEQEIAAVLEALRTSPTKDAGKEARSKVAELMRGATTELAQVPSVAPPFEVEPGSLAHYPAIGRDVEVLFVEGKDVVVAAGAMKVHVGKDELAAPKGQKGRRRFPARAQEDEVLERATAARAAELTAVTQRCDVRGLESEEALFQVQRFLDKAFREGDEHALIVHGHGTGTLRQVIRDYLASSPYVRLFRPGESHEGGNGVTIVALRV